MKNSTSYFYKNNYLNKGYQTIDTTSNDNSINSSLESKPLLEPKILEIFESAHPGSISKIIAIAEREQKHRHGYEISNLASYARARMFGQMISFISLLIIAYVTMNMVLNGNTNMAIMFSSLYFISVFSISIFSYLCHRNRKNTVSTKTQSFHRKRDGSARISKRHRKIN